MEDKLNVHGFQIQRRVCILFLVIFWSVHLVSGLLDGGDFIVVKKSDEIPSFVPLETCPNNNSDLRNIYQVQSLATDITQAGGTRDVEGDQVIQDHGFDEQATVDSEDTIEKIQQQVPPVIKAIPVKAPQHHVTDDEDSSTEKKTDEETQTESEQPCDERSAACQPPSQSDEEYQRQESAVEEESVEEKDPDVVIAPFSQWAEKKLEEQQVNTHL